VGRVSEFLEIPKDIALDLPRVTLQGNTRLVLENHKGITEYAQGRIRVQTPGGELMIAGSGLIIRAISRDQIVVDGRFRALEFVGWEVS
jgi:sporulation protein YqfC